MNTKQTKLDKIAAAIARKLQAIETPLIDDWTTLVPIEQLVTGYGKSIESVPLPISFVSIDEFELKKDSKYEASSYHNRFYSSEYKDNTHLKFISVSGGLSGHAYIEIIAQNEDNSRILRALDFNINNARFILPQISLNEMLSGDSLIVRITALSDCSINKLAWVGAIDKTIKNLGARIVLIRTFGNRSIVEENLARLTQYLVKKNLILQNYLFIVYDATSDDTPFTASDEINLLYLRGGNYGGGGNASLLAAAILKAGDLCPDVSIDEVILWDDDAIIEPQIFVRHDSFTTVRNPNVAHTGVILAKTSPDKIQEFGGYWGKFFDLKTGQTTVDLKKQRQINPYLIRYGRSVTQEFDRIYIGNHQEIEFGTFIYISIPYLLLKKCRGLIPFFLRNDDVELGLRIKANGGILVCNQNMFAWHEANHNIIGEFYSTLHGIIVNSAYFDLSRSWLIEYLMNKAVGAASLENSALLDAYKQAAKLFSDGPRWFEEGNPFKTYITINKTLSDRLKSYEIIPREVILVMEKEHKVQIHILTDSNRKNNDCYAGVVFYDTAQKRHLVANESEREATEQLLLDLAVIIGNLAKTFDTVKLSWKIFISEFDAVSFWDKFFTKSKDSLEFFKIEKPTYNRSELSISKITFSEKFVNQRITSDNFTIMENSSLPMDFDPHVYYKLNPDVLAANLDAADHYLRYGINENRRYR